MTMNVTQRELDAAAKNATTIREQVIELFDEARGLLTGDTKLPDDVTAANAANTAAHKMLNALSGVAALCATLRWVDALTAAVKANDPMDKVVESLKLFAFHDARRLLDADSPIVNAFEQTILEYAMDAAAFSEAMNVAYEKAAAVCAETGIDIVKVQAGDAETLKLYVAAVEKMTGKPIHPRVREALGLGPTPSESVAAIAESLGIDSSRLVEVAPGVYSQNVADNDAVADKDTIRA